MNTFSTGEIARILDVSPEWIRAQARGSLITPERTSRGHYRYSFQDLVLLRKARTLRHPDISARRVRSALRSLLGSLPPGQGLSSVQITSDGGKLLAGANNTVWDPETGQTAFVFPAPDSGQASNAPENRISSLPQRETSAASWFDHALELEQQHLQADAEEAYKQACRLDPSHINARINLGRLRHCAQDIEGAEAWYREALRIDPGHPIALFNLGVALEDRDSTESAIECYKLAIDADPEIAEAHYNLARLYARHSKESAAVRHYSRYRALVRETDS